MFAVVQLQIRKDDDFGVTYSFAKPNNDLFAEIPESLLAAITFDTWNLDDYSGL